MVNLIDLEDNFFLFGLIYYWPVPFINKLRYLSKKKRRKEMGTKNQI